MLQNEFETLTAAVPAPLEEAVDASWKDFLGIAASTGCAIHCAAMPIVIGYLPLLGLEFLADETFHQWMVLICFVIAIAAFVPGWRNHGRLLPATLGIVGLCIIAATAFFIPDTCCATDGGLWFDRDRFRDRRVLRIMLSGIGKSIHVYEPFFNCLGICGSADARICRLAYTIRWTTIGRGAPA